LHGSFESITSIKQQIISGKEVKETTEKRGNGQLLSGYGSWVSAAGGQGGPAPPGFSNMVQI